jgi:hypothetical protein
MRAWTPRRSGVSVADGGGAVDEPSDGAAALSVARTELGATDPSRCDGADVPWAVEVVHEAEATVIGRSTAAAANPFTLCYTAPRAIVPFRLRLAAAARVQRTEECRDAIERVVEDRK